MKPRLMAAPLVAAVALVSLTLLAVAWQPPHVAEAATNKCMTCKTLVDRFVKAMHATEKDGFGGGNTAWEEKSLGKYQTSETRLQEILEKTCSGKKDYECNSLLEESEEDIEEWFTSRDVADDGNADDTLRTLLCEDALKVCCPAGHFGKKCKPCPGGAKRPCRGNGKCQGDGTTRGSGKCECNTGYTGKLCNKCKKGYYMDVGVTDDMEGVVNCIKCHDSCKTCSGPGEDSCKECAKGYTMEGLLCRDNDECKDDKRLCAMSEYCVNTPGSYECKTCPEACDAAVGCKGPEPWQCKECAVGYVREDDTKKLSPCVDIDECAEGLKTCPTGTFCENSKGSALCRDCSPLCSDKGCTGGGSENCHECMDGFVRAEGEDAGCVRPRRDGEEQAEDAGKPPTPKDEL